MLICCSKHRYLNWSDRSVLIWFNPRCLKRFQKFTHFFDSFLCWTTWYCKISVWLNPGQARFSSQLSLHNIVDTDFLKSHFLKVNQSRHLANLTYFSFIKLEGLLEKQKVEHLNECQEEGCALEERLAWSLDLPTSLASSEPGPYQWDRRERQLREAEGTERKKRMKKKLRENERETHRWKRWVS